MPVAPLIDMHDDAIFALLGNPDDNTRWISWRAVSQGAAVCAIILAFQVFGAVKPAASATPSGSPAAFVTFVLTSAALDKQQCLYFFPLPHGHGAFRPYRWRPAGVASSSDLVSWWSISWSIAYNCGSFFCNSLGELEEILGQNRKEFVFVRVGVTVDVGMILGRMGKFLCHIPHPMLDRLPGNFGRQAVFDLLLLHQVNKLMNTHVVFARRGYRTPRGATAWKGSSRR